MDEPVGLEDLRQFEPSIVQSYQQLLVYDGDDFEEVFGLNFTVDMEVFGETKTYELCPGGASKSLTKDNREEYVRLATNWRLNESIKTQFEAFK